jgi:hypothetical protein
VPNGRYYLGNAGYVNTRNILTPFKRTRYHLHEIIAAKDAPETYQELFNLRHSTLKNEIKRIFKVLKRRFLFLQTPIEYDLLTQSRIIFAICGLYNFIRKHGVADDDIFEAREFEINELEEQNEDVIPLIIR